MICLCGHESARHRGKGSCRDCGQFGCDAYEAADGEADGEAEKIRVLNVVAEVCEGQAAKARAELAGIEEPPVVLLTPREQAEALAAAQPPPSLADAATAIGIATPSAALARVTAERDDLASLAEGFRRTIAELTEERDKALATAAMRKGQLTVARQRADETQRQRDDARTALANTASAYVATTAAAADVVQASDAWACLDDGGCGRRYGYPDPETHELTCGRRLTPVRVTITRRTAG